MHDETKIEERKLEEVIFLALGETSALFMSKDVKGTEIVMPSEKLEVIGDRILHFAKQYAEHYASQKIEKAKEICEEMIQKERFSGTPYAVNEIIKALTEL